MVLASLVEKTILSPWNCCHSFVKTQLIIFVWVCFCILYFIPVIYFFILFPTLNYLYYCKSIACLDIGLDKPSDFVFLVWTFVRALMYICYPKN